MANETLRDISGLPSPDPPGSEGNSSVQVNFDSLSNRCALFFSVPSRFLFPSPSGDAWTTAVSNTIEEDAA
jgi:hypothetical protein